MRWSGLRVCVCVLLLLGLLALQRFGAGAENGLFEALQVL